MGFRENAFLNLKILLKKSAMRLNILVIVCGIISRKRSVLFFLLRWKWILC